MPTKEEAEKTPQRVIKLERQLVRVRWFGVLFGVVQVVFYDLGPTEGQALKLTPSFLRPLNFAVFGVLVLVNIVATAVLRRTDNKAAISRLGALVFAADIACLLGLAWVYSFDHYETTWVLFYILTLEGALRYQLVGAFVPVIVAFPSELARDVFRHTHYHYAFFFTSVTYRVGVMGIVAFVAGIMARTSERERSQAVALAASESRALTEVRANHDIVLAGVAGGSFEETMRDIVDAMARTLGYEVFALGLVETDADGAHLRCVGARGHPTESLGRLLPVGTGVCGRVAQTGEPILVSDTELEDEYSDWVPGARSELCVPITSGGRVIGVIDIESQVPDKFSDEDLARLARLAPQVGLVISNARLLEQERVMVSRLRELDTMKDDFIAITSHELRSPLTSIRGFVGTLRRKDMNIKDEQREEYLAVIDRQTERLARLVEDLLITSHIEHGTLSIVAHHVDVPAAVRNVVAELGKDASRVRTTAPADFPAVLTDEQRLGQIVLNLLENALKFSPPDSNVDVEVALESGRLVLRVIDVGSGMSAEEIEKIFERFYQVGGPSGRLARGVGLGLYITHRLVEALAGTISVSSRPSEGTAFVVSLPFVPADSEDQRDAIA